jgi:hypothetical protein
MKSKASFHFSYLNCKCLFFTAVKYIFRIFIGVLPDNFLLISAKNNILREVLLKKLKFSSIYTGFLFILWYENYHISLVTAATHEIFIFITLDEKKILYLWKMKILYIHVYVSILIFMFVLNKFIYAWLLYKLLKLAIITFGSA